MTRAEGTDEAHLWIVNDEGLYLATHNRDGRYVMRNANALRCAVGDSIPDVPPSRVDWTALHAELLEGND